ncbi:hypothetical protein CCACVL1_10499 [Corchorus capsularis]|uniref:Uncharacterized protein n=1 Tax=Corchorus capsularis TaxID=210143 RepID=A0A1R3IQZ4_COCAP|nr:hypothetical protein CCACVL1_10499 [Corchorus capsularis]
MNEVMEKKRPRKLNFNAPLLSTRRPALVVDHSFSDKVSCTNSQGGWKDSSNGIPFCWEQAPGKPKKNLERRNDVVDDAETPRPKPPPCRWRPVPDQNHDEGCDADVDDFDDNDDDNDDVFSDAVEVLSLTEAIDIVEKAEKFHGYSSDGFKSKSDFDGVNLDSLEQSDHCPSPNFIIERFLPDATALAAASALNMSKAKVPYLCNYSESPPCVSQAVIKRRLSSPKGCGLEMLLPWRMKHKLCGVKSPIKESCSIVQPRNSAKQNKLFSSIVAPSAEWRCK